MFRIQRKASFIFEAWPSALFHQRGQDEEEELPYSVGFVQELCLRIDKRSVREAGSEVSQATCPNYEKSQRPATRV